MGKKERKADKKKERIEKIKEEKAEKRKGRIAEKKREKKEHLKQEKEHKRSGAGSSQKPQKKSKFFTYLIIALIAAFVYFFLKEPLIGLLKSIPWLWGFIEHVMEQIGHRTYLGLLYLAFFGGIFFIVLPVEGSFLLYIASGKEFFFVIPIVVIGYVGGLFTSYLMGFMLGRWLAKRLLKEKFDEKQERMKKTGGIVLFFSNLFPLPTPWISLVYGAMRYNLKHFITICLIGQALKFNLLYLGVEFLKPYYTRMWDVVKGMFSNFYEVLRGIF